jgi:hypothetical protein
VWAIPRCARALARMPLEQRTVIVLRYHLDWAIDEIAAALGCAPGTVKSRLHRGLQRLETAAAGDDAGGAGMSTQWAPGATPPTGDEYQVVRLGDQITTAIGEQGTDCTPQACRPPTSA